MSLFRKFAGNPVLTPAAFPDEIMYVFNPGAVKFGNEYLLMVDAATSATPIVFWLARSTDGIHFTPDPAPIDWPMPADGPESCVYDPRITRIGDEYIILYASQAPGRGVRTGMVRTSDFVRFERIEQEETGRNNRNSVLFPEKINGRYVRFDRPMGDDELEPSDMCVSYSDDLVHWKESKVLMTPRPGCWDSHKIGAGAVPIRTPQGWLEIYHGVDRTCNGFIYRLGVMLLDLDDPARIIARGVLPVLWPEHDYEMNGRVMNVVFTCNAICEPDGTVRIYYGAADSCIGLATAGIDDLIAACYAPNSIAERFFLRRIQCSTARPPVRTEAEFVDGIRETAGAGNDF